MVIKKTVKRKTVWRSLPIGADGEEVVHSAAAAGLATAPATTPTTRRQQRPPNNADNGCNIGVVYGNDVGGKCDADGDVIDAPPTSAAAPTHATVAPAAKHYAGSGRAVRHPLNAARTTYHDGKWEICGFGGNTEFQLFLLISTSINAIKKCSHKLHMILLILDANKSENYDYCSN